MRILALLAFLAGFCLSTASDKVSQAASPSIRASQIGQGEFLIEVQQAWPQTGKKKGKKKGKKGKGKKGKKSDGKKKSGGKKGKCVRLAEKHGWPKSECRNLKGKKKCGLLAEKHGLSRKECGSV